VRFAPLIAAAALALLASPAPAHRSGCHVAHSCPSDHHSYVWFDAQGRGWDCAEPGAAEYDPSRDRTVIHNGGLTYYCRPAGRGSSSPSSKAPPRPKLGRPRTFAPRTKAASCRLRGHLPDRACTPGGYFPGATRSVICRSGYAASVRHVTESTKDKVYAEYGIAHHSAGRYEVDHLVPVEAGGSNQLANLFPQPASPRPGFHEKDRLENAIRDRVCNDGQALRPLQRRIAKDWIVLYRDLVGSASAAAIIG
jgi:hypothetical protein